MQAILVKAAIAFTALLINLTETIRHSSLSRFVRLERCRSCHLVVPIFRPDAVGLAQAGRPGQHRFFELDADRSTQQFQNLSRILQNIVRANHWRSFSSLLAHEIENLLLLDETKIFERRLRIFLDVGKDHFPRVANEKTVRKIDNPLPIDLGQQMMRHLFLEKNVGGAFLPRLWNRASQLFDDFPA